MTVKQALLARLEESKGQFVSGRLLSEALHCSRAAVSKAAAWLKQDGYDIEAVPNKGYRLSEKSDILSAEALRPLLDHPDVSITIRETLPSTNRLLSQLAMEDALPSGSFVIAEEQTGGRGHLGHSFYSPKACGLYLSVLLRLSAQDSKAKSRLETLTCRAAVAACRAIASLYGVSLEIKWVNDLYARIDGAYRKIGGILTEAHTDFETGRCDFAVVGLGLNLTTPEGGYPEEIADLAGNLSQLLPVRTSQLSCSRIAAAFVNELLKAYEDDSAMVQYKELSLLPGKNVRVLDPFAPSEAPRKAVVLGITDEGRLRIRMEDGNEKTLSFGDVSLALPSAETV